MAADKAFESVINFVSSSKLNFSIYRNPFSAQLSLKKTFAKHFSDESTNSGDIQNEEKDSRQVEIKQLEDHLKDKIRKNINLKSLKILESWANPRKKYFWGTGVKNQV